jgi:hypothetical protein
LSKHENIYARFYDISIGYYTWFIATCNELSLMKIITSCARAALAPLAQFSKVDPCLICRIIIIIMNAQYRPIEWLQHGAAAFA